MQPVAIFVYGTLKRGQCRERCWPHVADSVRVGWVRSTLFTRHDYPALRPGDDLVLGELWSFAAEQLPAVLDVLDAVEQTNQPGLENLYDRVIVDVFAVDGSSLGQAHAYHYAIEPTRDGFKRVVAGVDGFSRWP